LSHDLSSLGIQLHTSPTGLSLNSRFIMNEAEFRGWKTKIVNAEEHLIEVYPSESDQPIAFLQCTSEINTAFGFRIQEEKMLVYTIGKSIGVPVPETIVYTPDRQDFPQELFEFLHTHQRLVVKPNNGSCGVGVTTNIIDEKSVQAAIKYAKQSSTKILIQKCVEGEDYRVMVLNGRTIAASLRCPPTVTGDGIKTISELIEIENTRPERGLHEEKPLVKIDVDRVREYLGADRFNSVPENGCEVRLLGVANMSCGGTTSDVTESMHPSIFQIAEKITDAVRLSSCGVDLLITGDITKPIGSGCQATVLEVNGSPGFAIHQCPTSGHARNVVRPVLNAIMKRRGQTASEATKAQTVSESMNSSIRPFAEIIDNPEVYLAVPDGEREYYASHNLSIK
jgi:D-alanine-D-alanine ligase-like ATP-grasp enzyme